jgi:hypothetical protein
MTQKTMSSAVFAYKAKKLLDAVLVGTNSCLPRHLAMSISTWINEYVRFTYGNQVVKDDLFAHGIVEGISPEDYVVEKSFFELPDDECVECEHPRRAHNCPISQQYPNACGYLCGCHEFTQEHGEIEDELSEDDIEQRLMGIESRVATDLQGIVNRIERLESRIDMENEHSPLCGLERRIAQLEARPSGDYAGISARLSQLELQMNRRQQHVNNRFKALGSALNRMSRTLARRQAEIKELRTKFDDHLKR